MNNKRKIVEDLIGSFFIDDSTSQNDIFEETNLILGYLNKTLDENQVQQIENRIANDDDFRFRLQLIKYELNNKVPQSRLIKLLYRVKILKSKMMNLFDFDLSLFTFGISGSNRLRINYLLPISISASAVLVFAILLNTPSYTFTQLTSSRSLFINKAWRGEENQNTIRSQKVSIKYNKEKLLLNWNITNPNTNNYLLKINQKEYQVKGDPTFYIDNYKFENDTLNIEIIEYYDDQPISKTKGVYLRTE